MSAPLPGGPGSASPGSGTPANTAPPTPTPPASGPLAATTTPLRWLLLGANIALLAICTTIGGSLMLFPPAHAAVPGAVPTATVFSGVPAISTGFGGFPSATPTRTPRRPTPTHSGGLPPAPTATALPTKPPQPTATSTATATPVPPTPANTPCDCT